MTHSIIRTLYILEREVELLNQAFTWTSLVAGKGKHVTISFSWSLGSRDQGRSQSIRGNDADATERMNLHMIDHPASYLTERRPPVFTQRQLFYTRERCPLLLAQCFQENLAHSFTYPHPMWLKLTPSLSWTDLAQGLAGTVNSNVQQFRCSTIKSFHHNWLSSC